MKTEINGVQLEAENLYNIANRGMVMTFRIISFPNNLHSIDTDALCKLLKDQQFMGCTIIGVEYFATGSQYIDRPIGLLLRPNFPNKE